MRGAQGSLEDTYQTKAELLEADKGWLVESEQTLVLHRVLTPSHVIRRLSSLTTMWCCCWRSRPADSDLSIPTRLTKLRE